MLVNTSNFFGDMMKLSTGYVSLCEFSYGKGGEEDSYHYHSIAWVKVKILVSAPYFLTKLTENCMKMIWRSTAYELC